MRHNDKALLLKRDNAFLALKKLIDDVLPAKDEYIPVVKKEQQLARFEILNAYIPNETFYFTFNLLTCELENVNGVDKWLGYPGKEFTVSQYLRCVHSDHVVLFNLLAHSMYQVLCKGIFKLHFDTQKYISQVALRHYDGEYYLYKKTTSVFQYDDKNRLLAQLNEFNKIGPYDGRPMGSRFTEMEELQKDEFSHVIFKMVLENLMEEKYFSKQEFELLKCYATDENITNNEAAVKMNVEIETIKTYNRRILEKARDTFTHPFKHAREVALRLRKEKILG